MKAKNHSEGISDLVVNQCPMGCSSCEKIYVNIQTGCRIVCKCKICNHSREKEELAQVVGSEASPLTTGPSEEIPLDNH